MSLFKAVYAYIYLFQCSIYYFILYNSHVSRVLMGDLTISDHFLFTLASEMLQTCFKYSNRNITLLNFPGAIIKSVRVVA